MTESDASPPSSAPTPCRRLFRIGLRALMLLVLLVGGGLGYVVHRAHVQRDAVAALRRGRNRVEYHRPFEEGRGRQPPPAPPAWLVDWLGVDYFDHVAAVFLFPPRGGVDLDRLGQLAGLVEFGVFNLDLGNRSQIKFETSDLDITDAEMAHLGDLTELTTVRFAGTKRITGRTLARLAGLHKLSTLSLEFMPIGDADLAHVAGHSGLRSLRIGATAVTDAGLVHLARLDRLEYLTLDRDAITGAGLEHLRGLTRLEGLSLGRTGVADVKALAGQARLRGLDLDNTPIADAGMAGLRGLPALQELRLDRTRVSDACLATLAALPALQSLDLEGTAVSDAGLATLAGMPALQHLDLEGTAVSDVGLAHLPGRAPLNWLDLAQTQVTAAGLAAFRRAHPLIKVLH